MRWNEVKSREMCSRCKSEIFLAGAQNRRKTINFNGARKKLVLLSVDGQVEVENEL